MISPGTVMSLHVAGKAGIDVENVETYAHEFVDAPSVGRARDWKPDCRFDVATKN